ncbi:MAG: PIN domain-containing protein [Armatimonadetes bacterium]|nr:PIN domain-containing protein [Anaerolineae bacterium]
MIVAILDTTVILHLFRKYQPAVNWLDTKPSYGITAITWLEVMQGTTSKANQAQSRATLDPFELLYLTVKDQRWAMEQLERFQFSHHIRLEDCLIAAVAQRLQVPLYTHNVKDMTPMIGGLAIKPYA